MNFGIIYGLHDYDVNNNILINSKIVDKEDVI